MKLAYLYRKTALYYGRCGQKSFDPVASSLSLLRVARHEIKDGVSIDYFDKLEHTIKKSDIFVPNIIDYYKNSKQQEVHEEVKFEELIDDMIESVKSHLDTADAHLDSEVIKKNRLCTDAFRMRKIFKSAYY